MVVVTMIVVWLNIKNAGIQMMITMSLVDANERMMRKIDAKVRQAIVEMTVAEGN